MLMTATLLKPEGEKVKVLASVVKSSDNVRNPSQLEALKNGDIDVEFHLENVDYLTMAENRETIEKDQIVNFQVKCNLKRD